jgi:transcriptional regulator with XRE-family HTH domain
MGESSFGERLHKARTSKKMSYNELSFQARTLLPRHRKLTGEAIRLYEIGTVPEDRVDPVVVAAIAIALEVNIKDLSPLVASDLVTIGDLFARCT